MTKNGFPMPPGFTDEQNTHLVRYCQCPACRAALKRPTTPPMPDYDLDPNCAGCIGIPNKSGVHTCEGRKGVPYQSGVGDLRPCRPKLKPDRELTLSEEIEQVNRLFGPKCKTCGADLPDGGVTGFCEDHNPADRIAELRKKYVTGIKTNIKTKRVDPALREPEHDDLMTIVDPNWAVESVNDINELLDMLEKKDKRIKAFHDELIEELKRKWDSYLVYR